MFSSPALERGLGGESRFADEIFSATQRMRHPSLSAPNVGVVPNPIFKVDCDLSDLVTALLEKSSHLIALFHRVAFVQKGVPKPFLSVGLRVGCQHRFVSFDVVDKPCKRNTVQIKVRVSVVAEWVSRIAPNFKHRLRRRFVRAFLRVNKSISFGHNIFLSVFTNRSAIKVRVSSDKVEACAGKSTTVMATWVALQA